MTLRAGLSTLLRLTICVGMAACLRGEVYHRPTLEGRVEGAVARAGGCTFLFDTCEEAFPVPLEGASFHVAPWTKDVTMFLGADPEIGLTLIWACGVDGTDGAATIGGDVVAGPPVSVSIRLGDRTIPHFGPSHSRRHPDEEVRALVAAACKGIGGGP